MLSLSNNEKELLRKISSYRIVANESDTILTFKLGSEIIQSFPLASYDTDITFSSVFSDLVMEINSNGFYPKEVDYIDANCKIRATETKYSTHNGYLLFLEGHCYLETEGIWSSYDSNYNKILLEDTPKCSFFHYTRAIDNDFPDEVVSKILYLLIR